MTAAKPSAMNVLKIVDVPSAALPLASATIPPAQPQTEHVNGNGRFSTSGVEPSQFHNVVTLNVGGTIHTTSLATLQKYPDSMLAVMFSGRHHLATDEHGRYFIDRDGRLFNHILNFLRQNKMPPLADTLEVYEEAMFYNITPLISALDQTCPVASHKIRKMFLDEIPHYQNNVETLIEKAREAAREHPDRVSKLHVCVFKEEAPVSPYENSLLPLVPGERNPNHYQKNHTCDVSLTFGPWHSAPDVYDLIHCIKLDLLQRGYTLECQCIGVCDQHLAEQFYCKRPIYEFKFKWW